MKATGSPRLGFKRTAACAAFLLLCAADAPDYAPSPVATADANASDIEQMAQVIKNLGNHLRLDNEDTRFIPDTTLSIFGVMHAVGFVHYPSEADPKITSMGTGTLLNPCWVLTAYHVLEGRDVIDKDKQPLTGRHVKFWLRLPDERGAYTKFADSEAIAVDPGILNLTAGGRAWRDDMVLLRLTHRINVDTKMDLATLDGIPLHQAYPPSVQFPITLVAGYPYAKIHALHRMDVYSDFCRILSNDGYFGIATDCEIEGGMSGGPLFLAMSDSLGHYKLKLVGINIQRSSGNSLFSKESGEKTAIAAFDRKKIAKINAIISKQDCPV